MNLTRKLCAAALAVVFTALPGCLALLDDDTWTYEEHGGLTYEESSVTHEEQGDTASDGQSGFTQELSTPETEESAPEYGEWRPQGSVNTLEGKSVIVTILLDTPDADFTEDEISYANGAIERSCRYLEQQGEKYGKSVTLYNYNEENSDLLFRISCDKPATDAVDFSADTYTGFKDTVDSLIANEIPFDDIYKKYGTDSIGFMVMLDAPGVAYAQVYYPDGYYYGYNEWVSMFMHDIYGDRYENLACYAHEMLHLFGAIDLYSAKVSDGFYDYMAEDVANDPDYSMAIMYNTYNPDGSYDYYNIPQELSDITLAMIGLTDGADVFEKYPSLARNYTAAFENKAAY